MAIEQSMCLSCRPKIVRYRRELDHPLEPLFLLDRERESMPRRASDTLPRDVPELDIEPMQPPTA